MNRVCAWCPYETTGKSAVVKVTNPAKWVLIVGCPDCDQVREHYLCDRHGGTANQSNYECLDCHVKMEALCGHL